MVSYLVHTYSQRQGKQPNIHNTVCSFKRGARTHSHTHTHTHTQMSVCLSVLSSACHSLNNEKDDTICNLILVEYIFNQDHVICSNYIIHMRMESMLNLNN